MNKLLLLLILFIPVFSFGQWSNAPQNALIIDSTSNQMDAENIFVGNSFFFSWVRTYGSRPKRMLARYSVDGYKVWEHNNMLQTSDRLINNSSYSKINLRADNEDNVVLIQLAQHKETLDIYPIVAKIDYDGNPVWSTARELFIPGFNAEEHRFCSDKNGNSFFAVRWNEKDTNHKEIVLYKITDNGFVEWQKKLMEYESTSAFNEKYFNISTTDHNGFHLIYSTASSILDEDGQYRLYEELRINKISDDGVAEWTRDELIYRQRRNFYTLKIWQGSDNSFYSLWIDSSTLKIQKTNAEAYPIWDPWGIELTEYPRFYGYYCFGGEFSNGDFLMFYTQEADSIISLFGQKISPSGQKLWGEGGKEIRQFNSNNFYSPYQFKMYKDTILYFYDQRDTALHHSESTFIDAVDKNGNLIWDTPLQATSHKWHTLGRNVATDNNGRILYSWTTLNYPYYLKAQSFYLDKTFGNRSTSIKEIVADQKSFLGYDQVNKMLIFTDMPLADHYSLYNLQGQFITDGKTTERPSLGDLPAGIYILSLSFKGKQEEVFKIYIQ